LSILGRGGPVYPSIVQSIIEAKHITVSTALVRGIFTPWLGWLALLSATVVVAFRPIAILLLPLVVLHVSSVFLGVRFTMFGGAGLIIFLGVAFYWLVNYLAKGASRRAIISLGAQLCIGIGFLVYCHSQYSQLPITPVLTKAHAEALTQLGVKSKSGSMVWTWWDWGYASQYYAGLETVIDGGKHSGRDIFPVAFVMSTASLKEANRMIAFSSQYPSESPFEFGPSPARYWDTIPRGKILGILQDQLAKTKYPIQADQYLVVTWKDLTLAKWISYFGNWNLETGTTREYSVGTYNPGELGFNLQQGAVMNRNGGGGLVSDITILGLNGVETTEYYMNRLSPRLLPKRRHLVINEVSRQSVLVDRSLYKSVMMRLLVGDPNDPEISKYFKLVVDKLPFARIYEVVQ